MNKSKLTTGVNVMPLLSDFLRNREIGNYHLNTVNNSRRQYKSITPNQSIHNLDLPNYINVIIGWSPCGKFLITFSISSQSVIAYTLKSLYDKESFSLPFSSSSSSSSSSFNHNNSNDNNNNHQQQQQHAFEHGFFLNSNSSPSHPIQGQGQGQKPSSLSFMDLFEPVWESKISLVHGEILCREFCMITTKWIILASSQFRFIGAEEESVTELENYRFYLIDLTDGILKSQLTVQRDHINLDHHSGISIFANDLLLITLLYSQEIRIYKIINNQFVLYKVIGKYLYDGDNDNRNDFDDYNHYYDQPLYSIPEENNNNNNNSNDNNRSNNVNIDFIDHQQENNSAIIGFRQKVLTFIYKNCSSKRLYYENLKYFLNLQIWKAQFINSDNLLIKLGPKIQIQSNFHHVDNSNSSSSSTILIVYNYKKCLVESLWRANSKELVNILFDYSDYLRFSTHDISQCWSCTLSNCPWQRESWDRQLLDSNIGRTSLRNNSNHHGLLASLPCSFQNWQYNPSPFLDEWLFRFDEKLIHYNINRSSFVDLPIKFFCRDSEKLLFTLSLNNSSNLVGDRTKRYIRWIFHPHLALIICQQQTVLRNTQISIYYRE